METRRNLQESLVETPSAKEVVLFANSPSFLLERLCRDTSTQNVAHEFSTQEIVDFLKQSCEKPPKEATDLVRIYVFLVALSLKDDLRDLKAKLVSIDMHRIEWADRIREMILSEQTPTGVYKVEITREASSSP